LQDIPLMLYEHGWADTDLAQQGLCQAADNSSGREISRAWDVLEQYHRRIITERLRAQQHKECERGHGTVVGMPEFKR